MALAASLPVNGGVYAGAESVSVGLNELSDQMRSMPDLSLVDQFGRQMTRTGPRGPFRVLIGGGRL